MNGELSVQSERVDDIPVLLATIERMGIPQLVDEHYPAHGNWRGLLPGKLLAVWLSHILSMVDHRLNQVRLWAAQLTETLAISLNEPVSELDFTDDRLAWLLDRLGDDASWRRFENALNHQVIRVYSLATDLIRTDTTSVSGYWQVSAGGMFQFGHARAAGPSDQPQLKVLLSSLDPLGMPLVTQPVAGNRADDPLYVPAMQQVRESLGPGRLYVGDSKMAAQATRAFLHSGGDRYLMPLPKKQLPAAVLQAYLEPVGKGAQALQPVERVPAEGTAQVIAEGYEREEGMRVLLAGQEVTWRERRLVVRSLAQAQTQTEALHSRLDRAQRELEAFNEHRQGKKIYREVAPLRQKVAAVLKRFGVEGLLRVTLETRLSATTPQGKPKPVVWVQVQRNRTVIQQVENRLGWHVYATNAPQESLSLAQAVLAYRNEYIVEHGFGRLKGKPLSLSPMYLQDDRRATGLVRLLSVGLRVLTLLEFSARRRLAQDQDTLAGIYPGNPKRATRRPSAELMLAVFEHLTLSVVRVGQETHRHLPPLSPTQRKILTLLDLPVLIYTRLTADLSNPP